MPSRMIDMNRHTVLLALALATASTAAFAQDPATEKADRIVLEKKVGGVMASTGGDYQTADIGREFKSGDSLMVNDKAEADAGRMITKADLVDGVVKLAAGKKKIILVKPV